MRLSLGPWLFGPAVDLLVFAGSAGLALLLVALRPLLGLPDELPEWGWVLFVLGVDVAHVYATLFRTYLDGAELARHPMRYTLAPLGVYLAGVAIYGAFGPEVFWRVLAYVAVFHFVRQQAGWVALYRARAGTSGWADRLVDDAAVYAATLYPLVVWHARLDDTAFHWLSAHDFADVTRVARAIEPIAEVVWAIALSAFAVRFLGLAITRRTVQAGKAIVVLTTALLWYVGIVARNSDFDFTVTNVIAHGVPYMALLFAYARARRAAAPGALASRFVEDGVLTFLIVILACAFVEEALWDQLVWAERPWLFGTAGALSANLLPWVVPLLAVPQGTHYVLDGMLWRRRDTAARPAQRLLLGRADHSDGVTTLPAWHAVQEER